MFLGENICSAGSHQYAQNKSGKYITGFPFCLDTEHIHSGVKEEWDCMTISAVIFLSSVSASPNTFYTFPTLCCANDTSWVSAGGKKQPYLYSYVPTQPLSVYPCLCICICIEIPPGFHSHLYIPVQCQIALCNMRSIIARYIYNTISLSTVHIVGI